MAIRHGSLTFQSHAMYPIATAEVKCCWSCAAVGLMGYHDDNQHANRVSLRKDVQCFTSISQSPR